MARRFDDKVVFITGASSGIGAAAAREFAREGAKLALAARRADRLAEVKESIEAAGGEALVLECDVTDRASIDAAVAKTVEAFGGIDVVLANAGFGVSGVMTKLETDDFRRQFATNFFGVLDTVYAALPHLLVSKGRLGIVSSVMGRVGMPASGPYCASKFALAGLSEALYYDLADNGVSVSCINPGIVESEIRSVSNAGEYTGKPDPAPKRFTMKEATAARIIVRGLYRRVPEFTFTRHGRIIVFMSRHFPRLTRLTFRTISKGRLHKVEKAKRGDMVQ